MVNPLKILVISCLFSIAGYSQESSSQFQIDSLEDVLEGGPSFEDRIRSERQLSILYRQVEDFSKADEHTAKTIDLANSAPKKERSKIYYSLSNDMLTHHKDFDRAISLLYDAERDINEEEEPELATYIYLQLGYVLGISGDTLKSDSYFLKAYEKSPDDKGLQNYTLFRVLETFHYQDDKEDEFNKYAKIAEADTAFQNGSWWNAYLVMKYGKLEQYERCDSLLQIAFKEAQESGDQARLVYNYALLVDNYAKMGDYESARRYGLEGYEIGVEHNLTKEKADVLTALIPALDELGDYKNALDMERILHSLQTDIRSREYRDMALREEQKTAQLQIQQQELENQKSSLALKESEIQLQKEASQKNWFIAGGLVFLVLAIIAVFAYRQKRKDNQLIEHQKLVLEEKNKEILDSISYAKRIQSAILPSDKRINSTLPESFVLYKPKDIVAGDFYWMEQTPERLLIAAADCTGHGVPGAMVSVVCNNGLNRSVREYKIIEPEKILDKTRELVNAEFEKSEEQVRDGMDIALVSIQNGTDDETKTLRYAGAHNPLWVVRSDSTEIEEIKADKQPIGLHTEEKPFTGHDIQLKKGDMFYIFSDGYADQFGGEKGKKLKATNFKKLLFSLRDLSMSDQKERLDHEFERWKGPLEQLDDVCVIGIRV